MKRTQEYRIFCPAFGGGPMRMDVLESHAPRSRQSRGDSKALRLAVRMLLRAYGSRPKSQLESHEDRQPARRKAKFTPPRDHADLKAITANMLGG